MLPQGQMTNKWFYEYVDEQVIFTVLSSTTTCTLEIKKRKTSKYKKSAYLSKYHDKSNVSKKKKTIHSTGAA